MLNENGTIKYIDISPVVSTETAVFPGDVPYSRAILYDFEKGDSLLLSSIQSTLHVGAHADAPNHYNPQGEDIADRPLNYYMGPCQVISVSLERGKRIYPQDIKGIEIRAPRVLFKTSSFPDRTNWNTDYNSLSPELLQFLNDRAVILVGIDTPSVDPDDSKNLESHQALYESNMANLEGLLLDEVEDGIYTLIALPLKLKDCDGSPVRAILLPTS